MKDKTINEDCCPIELTKENKHKRLLLQIEVTASLTINTDRICISVNADYSDTFLTTKVWLLASFHSASKAYSSL